MRNPLFDPEGPDYSLLYGGDAVHRQHPAREIWDHWISEWRSRVESRRDNIIAIDGPTGEGKSALGYRVSRRLDPTFDRHRVVYSAAETLTLWGEARPGWVVLYDESVRGLLSRNFRTEENTLLVQVGMTARKLGVTVILCIPDFMFLDVGFRSVLTKYRLVVRQRGEATVHVRTDRPRWETKDPRRHYLVPEWSPLTWTNPDGEREWDAIYQRSIELTRKFATDSARQLEARRQLDDPEVRLREKEAKASRAVDLRDRVLAKIQEGFTHDEVADLLGVGARTVDRIAARARSAGALGEA